MTTNATGTPKRQRSRSNVIALVRQFQKLGMRPSKVDCGNGAVIYFDLVESNSNSGIEQELATLRMRKNAR